MYSRKQGVSHVKDMASGKQWFPTQELSEGKIQVAAVYNLRKQVLVHIAGGDQRALSGISERGRGDDDTEL